MKLSERLFHLLVGALLVAGYFAGLPAALWEPVQPRLVPAQPVLVQPSASDHWHLQVASDAETPLVHAASMVELTDGRIRAFWFAGEREGSRDVGIHTAVLDPATGRWSAEQRILAAEQVEVAFGVRIRKLGNALPVRDDDGRLRLFVVNTSFAGWAASRLIVLESDDEGASWTLTDFLVLSPFLNISYLVKGSPVRFDDGTLGLPIYHELAGKYGELLRLDADNRILSRARIAGGRQAIQPVLFVDSPVQVTALLRNETRDTPGFVFRSDSDDAGQHWTPLRDSGIEAASAALGGVSLGPGHWLVALNNNRFARDDLTLLETRDSGDSWRPLVRLFDRAAWRMAPVPPDAFDREINAELKRLGVPATESLLAAVRRNKCLDWGCAFQYDYPYLMRASNGDLHLLFTWNKTLIGHAWWRAGEAQP